MKAALLPERGVVKVSGETARPFLNGLLTNDIGKVTPEHPRFSALLTPQGKIIVDCIVVQAPEEDGGGFFLDCPKALAPSLAERLNFYKLRAKLDISDVSREIGVMAVWPGPGATQSGLIYPDPRLPALGYRVLLPPQEADAVAEELAATLLDASAYDEHRIALGVPRGGVDFVYGDAFPHETDMDQLGGVDFGKGCYVGQEVVSRMEHRGTARNRIVSLILDHGAPEEGLPVTAGDKTIGTMGSSAGGRGIATLRLDRAADAREAGIPLQAGNITVRAVKPSWARFEFPGET
jgi:folate-binding protein YgfZ